jgi:hypothetical protein
VTDILPLCRPYVPDHSSLLLDLSRQPGKRPREARVDALAVPAARRPENLQEAVRVARVAARGLIVLCSQDCEAEEAARVIEGFGTRVPTWIVDMKDYRFPHQSQTLNLSRHVRWPTDTALKRNAALLFARCLGLKHLLFLDDDVRGVPARRIKQAVAELEAGSFRAAGWAFTQFPDNSAVSHAYRGLSDPPYGQQGCFTGGGGLLVGLDEDVPHFPLGIYNEDWLFLYRLLADSQVANLGSLTTQLGYDPFRNTGVAVRQEFGDLIAESLISLLADRRNAGHAELKRIISSEEFWSQVFKRRSDFLHDLVCRVSTEIANGSYTVSSSAGAAAGDRVLSSLRAASSARFGPKHLSAWVAAWNEDSECWRRLWERIGRSVEQAGPATAVELPSLDLLRDIGLASRVQLLSSPSTKKPVGPAVSDHGVVRPVRGTWEHNLAQSELVSA